MLISNIHNIVVIPEGGRCYVVDCFDNAKQRRVGSNRHVRATEIVVDGADDADDVQIAALIGVLRRNFFCQRKNRNSTGDKNVYLTRIASKLVRAGAPCCTHL